VPLSSGQLVSRVGDGDVPGTEEDDRKGRVPLLASESGKRYFLAVKGGETEVGPGSYVFVPPDEEHAFANAGTEVFTFLCAIPATKVCLR